MQQSAAFSSTVRRWIVGTLKIGDLIEDNLGRKGIVAECALKPAPSWLKAQDDRRLRAARGPWWNVFPLDGGAVLVPESLARRLGRASVDDVAAMISDDPDGGVATLRRIFKNLGAESGRARRPKRPR